MNPSSYCMVASILFLSAAHGCGVGDSADVTDPDYSVPEDDIGAEPLQEWQWIEIEGARCAQGGMTGMGYNRGSSDKLVIFMDGDGACFSPVSCKNWAGFDREQFTASDADRRFEQLDKVGFLNRQDAANPIRDWSFAFFPHCTGDMFAGTTEEGYGGRLQVGYRNVSLYLETIKAKFPDLSQIVLSGSSAGAVGAVLNYEQVQHAFADIPVYLVNDSGPLPSSRYFTSCMQRSMLETWSPDGSILPADCRNCDPRHGGEITNVIKHLAESHPEGRFAFISSLRDLEVRMVLGLGKDDCAENFVPLSADDMNAALVELRDDILGPYDNVHWYLLDSEQHTWLSRSVGEAPQHGPSLAEWLGLLINDVSEWTDVSPPLDE